MKRNFSCEECDKRFRQQEQADTCAKLDIQRRERDEREQQHEMMVARNKMDFLEEGGFNNQQAMTIIAYHENNWDY
jgi:hypothetical protein